MIQSARACAKKRQKTEGESENEARFFGGRKASSRNTSLPNFVLPGKFLYSSLLSLCWIFATVPIEESSWQSVLLREE